MRLFSKVNAEAGRPGEVRFHVRTDPFDSPPLFFQLDLLNLMIIGNERLFEVKVDCVWL